MISETVPHELDVFSVNPYQLAIERYEDVHLTPINSYETNNHLEFQLNGHSNIMLSISEISLLASIKVVKGNNGPYMPTDLKQPYLCNNVLSSLFRSCSVFFNQVQVANTSDNFGLAEIISSSLNFSHTTTSSKLSNNGFFTAEDQKDLEEMFKNSKKIQLMTKLNICNTDKLLIPNVSLGIKLGFQQPDFYFVESEAGAKSKIVIDDIRLIVRRFILRDSYVLHMEQMLTEAKATYEWPFIQIVPTTIPAGQSSVSLTSVWNGIRPSFLLLAFLENETYTGSRETNPMKFKHFDLKQACFTVNNENCPKVPFEMNFSDEDQKYGHIFNSLYSALGLQNENVSTVVNRKSFLTDFFFLAKDITPFSTALSSLNDPLDNASIGFNLMFSKPLEKSITVLLFMLLPRKVEISDSRSISVIY